LDIRHKVDGEGIVSQVNLIKRDLLNGYHCKLIIQSTKPGSPQSRRDRICAPKRSGAQAQREVLFVIQSRETRDWITRFIPSGINSDYAHSYGTAKNTCSDTKESFFFGGLSPFLRQGSGRSDECGELVEPQAQGERLNPIMVSLSNHATLAPLR